MGGFLLLIIYLLTGFVLAHFLFTEKRITVRVWLGVVIGMIGLMWSHVPFSFVAGFTVLSHILGYVFFAAVTVAVAAFRHKKRGVPLNIFKSLKGSGKTISSSDKTMFVVLLVFMLFCTIMIFNHTLAEVDGGYYTGQSTFGDMNFHLGIITSIARQETFPPDYNIFPGARLDYYFLCDSVSSSLYKFGTGLRMAYILPMLVGFAAVFAGFWILADAVLKEKKRVILSFLLFFLNGGLGTFFLLDKEHFTKIFTGYYCTPTNYRFKGDGETTIVWTNALCDMMLPQRATLFGWMVAMVIFYLLYTAVFRRENRNWLPAGIITGLAPMIQTYTFFATGLIAMCWLVYTAMLTRKGGAKGSTAPRTWKEWLTGWLSFGVPAVLLAVPQFIIWIFGAVGGDSFLRLDFNAYNEAGDFWPWFWIKNVGIVFVLLIPAFISASREKKAMYSGAILIFAVTELIVFQTLAYDNNKLYFMWYLFSCLIVSDWVIGIFEGLTARRKKALGGVMLAAVVFLGTNAAVLTNIREIISGVPGTGIPYCGIGIYGREQVEACDYIVKNIDGKATFITAYNHNNAVSSLTGCNIYCGAGTFLYSHGVDYRARQQQIQTMFRGGAEFEQLKSECGIDYVYISPTERAEFKDLNQEYFDTNYPVLYDANNVKIYDVR